VYCVFSGLHDTPHWQEFPVKWSKVQHLVKNWTKQPLQTFFASKSLHFKSGELLSITDQDVLHQDIFKGHVHNVNHSEQFDDLCHKSERKILVIKATQLKQVALMVARIPVWALNMR
jgi:hypothetical protein